MSKKIHTIYSSDKIEFENKVNYFLELGCELLEGSYEIFWFNSELQNYEQIKSICYLNKDGDF